MAKYRGRTVKLNKVQRGDVKKFKVFVRNTRTGRVQKVNFGQKGMSIGRNDPARRKSFMARFRPILSKVRGQKSWVQHFGLYELGKKDLNYEEV